MPHKPDSPSHSSKDRVSSRRRYRWLRPLGWVLLGALLPVIGTVVLWFQQKPALSPWHDTFLNEDYSHREPAPSFDDYLKQEQRVFDELAALTLSDDPADRLNRYQHGSLSDPARWGGAGNRSYEWPNPEAEYALLLLHGLTDSPYSVAHFANHFAPHSHVLGLRLPGHGTLPSALVELEWQDLTSAVELAADHLAAQHPDKPLIVVGYSTGAPLALELSMRRIRDGEAAPFDAMVFVSPAIGVTAAAAAARWQSRLGHLLGLDKLAWNSVIPEYHPFKYNSFAINGGDLVHRLLRHNRALLASLSEPQRAMMPPVLSFQSLTDATVTPSAVLDLHLLQRRRGDDELVLFDINRRLASHSLLRQDPIGLLERYAPLPGVTVVENQFAASGKALTQVQARDWQEGRVETLPWHWPDTVHSLSHISMPMPAEDPVLGNGEIHGEHIQLGNMAVRGEYGVLAFSSALLLRQQWNPFFPYLLQRTDAFIERQLVQR
ncbi:alpha/beta hydrolase [Ferrimonas marina]|uniref:Serine aminopeptidase, S33 n=1 Tax=Ferrimonas marina TaxID=299255 RepID=A0A1M5VSK2_9GAMM|nr:alpha/beta fold hydrolase [Ferrimonas marina]SHH78158.1 Serine aminopeptidase, S33 [Ferrimonas marina]